MSASSASTSASLVSKHVTSRAIVSPVLGARSERAERVDIASAAKAARHEVRAHAAELAVDLAAGKIRARMSPTTDEALTGAFLDGIEKKPGVRPHEELN